MASLDEEIQEQTNKQADAPKEVNPEDEEAQADAEEEDRRQAQIQRYDQQKRLEQQQQEENQGQNLANNAQTIQKWYKRYKKTILVVGFLTSGTGLWILLIFGIIGTFVAGCNNSETFRLGVDITASGACEPFIIGEANIIQPQPQAPAAPNNSPQPYGKLTDAEARAQLASANITVNHPKPQTSLEGVNQATINEILSVAHACDAWARSTAQAPQTATPGNACNVIITGGTEDLHAEGTCSHQNGYKLDIGLNGTINNYIMNSGFASEGKIRSDGARQFFAGTSIYALESNHWDILVGCG